MSLQRYTVRRINLFPLAKFGCLLGGLAMLLPGLICAVSSVQIIAALSVLLEQWRETELDPLGLGTPVEFDFVSLLGLEILQTAITRFNDQRLVLVVLIVLTAMIGGGLIIGVSIWLLGGVYNLVAALTGGLEVELREGQQR